MAVTAATSRSSSDQLKKSGTDRLGLSCPVLSNEIEARLIVFSTSIAWYLVHVLHGIIRIVLRLCSSIYHTLKITMLFLL